MQWILGGTLAGIDLDDQYCASICLPFGGPGVVLGVQWTDKDGNIH